MKDCDIFSPHSEYMKTFDKKINFQNKSLPKLTIPQNFKQIDFNLPTEGYEKQIREIIEPTTTYAEKLGYGPNIFTALYETILNAHQHGNQKEKKNITLASLIKKNNLEIIVADQGNSLHPSFMRFILTLRQKEIKNGFINWYKFSNQIKPQNNNGTGTSFMHAYMDKIEYYISENEKTKGGLCVKLYKKNKN